MKEQQSQSQSAISSHNFPDKFELELQPPAVQTRLVDVGVPDHPDGITTKPKQKKKKQTASHGLLHTEQARNRNDSKWPQDVEDETKIVQSAMVEKRTSNNFVQRIVDSYERNFYPVTTPKKGTVDTRDDNGDM